MRFPRLLPLVFCSLLALGLCAPAPVFAARKNKASSGDDAGVYRGAIVLDAATGRVLSESNADVVCPPASMAKLMTFAVIADKLQSGALTLDTMVQIDASDARMGGTQVYLDPRETFSVEDLIYAMMIQSANDAAHALARTAGGSVPGFVELMNAKALEIGMRNTTFRTPHGLTSKRQDINEGDLTTPRDFAALCRHLVLKTDVLKYSSVKQRDFGTGRAQGPIRMENHNKLLGRVAGVDGLKTGYTQNAGYCLSTTAERNGHRVIVVIMGCFGPEPRKIDMGKSRDLRSIELLEKGFAAIPASDPAFVSEYRPNVPAGATQLADSPIAHAPIEASSAGQPSAPAASDEPMIRLNFPTRAK
ncbi:MAG TPA: D-alanyl-D-alanine carboxypeptidase family protein [Opitutaceae bacterium]|nr:D-alanyl-D-alanine carboxypeptidase [Opitutaceae bacterium]HOF08443.1 D-alanyl-D-alanine carboxypeptidase family protein [Opitutaceae bacterium]HOR25929.1 D-alanyl-D-alanine carboxypeptidase family protein [Opitutaceae bacterium]HPK49117.1 D-alanyl-D-alanine carboxypeptidase family protein [Opitutaceae bacterium]